MLTPQGELPSLYKSPEARETSRNRMVERLTKYLHERDRDPKQREREINNSKLIYIGAEHPVVEGELVVHSDSAHSYLSGGMTRDVLMSNAVRFVDRASDWSFIEVVIQGGEHITTLTSHVKLGELLSIDVRFTEHGYVKKETLPPNETNDEYLKQRTNLEGLLEKVKLGGKYVAHDLSYFGLNSLTDEIGIRVGEIGRSYLENWFNSLDGRELGRWKRRLAIVRVGTAKPIYPEQMGRKLLFVMHNKVDELRNVRMLRVLQPLVMVGTKRLLYNRVKQIFFNSEGNMNPERVSEPIIGYPIFKNQFNPLKKEFEGELEKLKQLEIDLRERFRQEFEEVLIASLHDVLGISNSERI